MQTLMSVVTTIALLAGGFPNSNVSSSNMLKVSCGRITELRFSLLDLFNSSFRNSTDYFSIHTSDFRL